MRTNVEVTIIPRNDIPKIINKIIFDMVKSQYGYSEEIFLLTNGRVPVSGDLDRFKATFEHICNSRGLSYQLAENNEKISGSISDKSFYIKDITPLSMCELEDKDRYNLIIIGGDFGGDAYDLINTIEESEQFSCFYFIAL